MPARLKPLSITLLVAFAAGSWWLAERTAAPTAAPAEPDQGLVDYYVLGLDVTRMTADGAPAHRLRSANLRRLTGDQTTELARPLLTVFRADGAPPWRIESDDALVSADGETILLRGEVSIERDGDADTAPVLVRTRNLRYRPADEYAETDEPVTVTSNSDRIDAVGMEAWLRPPSRIRFLSEVRGRYASG